MADAPLSLVIDSPAAAEPAPSRRVRLEFAALLFASLAPLVHGLVTGLGALVAG